MSRKVKKPIAIYSWQSGDAEENQQQTKILEAIRNELKLKGRSAEEYADIYHP